MKVKRYMGKTKQEIILKIKDELGKDAVILSSRRIRQKGLKGWFSKPLIEIVAAVDDVVYSSSKTRSNIDDKTLTGYNSHGRINNDKRLESIEAQMKYMGNMVQKLLSNIDKTADDSGLNPKYALYYQRLADNGVEDSIAKAIINKADKLYAGEEMESDERVNKVLLSCLGRPRPMSISPGQRKVALFLGPTGVGKTTTLAKLAASFAIAQQKRVGLITADTYRIAAVEQLKVYGEILGIPVDVIYSSNEIQKALDNNLDKDIILIDTPGKSINDIGQEMELKKLISESKADEIFLAISSNTSYQACTKILNSYKYIPDYKFIFTKMDECDNNGIIFNCCFMAGKPLSYITNGQSVPDDIEIANPEAIVEQLIGSKNNG